MTYYLGVDLGTSFTAVAVRRDGAVEIAQLGNRNPEIPSVIFLSTDGTTLVGDIAERRGADEPDRVAREFKRRLADSVPLLLGGTPFSAHALTARLLSNVVARTTQEQGEPPTAIVVTHPANWGPYKRELLVQSIHMADLGTEVQLFSEPEAASVWYASTERLSVDEIIAVYDLGGGTFDAAVLRKTEGGFQLLGIPEGIEQLGGVDFDEAVFGHVIGALDLEPEVLDYADLAVTRALSRLRRDCTAAKEALSFDTETVIPVYLPSLHARVRLTRREFEALISPRLAETSAATHRALTSAGVEVDELSAILLAGGSCRIPLIAEHLSSTFHRPVAVDPHPEQSIALGAALLAAPRGASASSGDAVSRSSTSDIGKRSAAESLDMAASVSDVARSAKTTRVSRRRAFIIGASAAAALVTAAGATAIARRQADDALPGTAAANSWQRLPDLPVALEGAAVAAFGGRVWVAGGLSNDADRHKLTSVFIYDPSTNAWTIGPSVPQPLSHAALSSSASGLYLMGGWIQSGGSSDVLRLDDSERGWTAKASLPSPRVSGAAAWDGTRIIYAGGTKPGGGAAKEVWAYSSGRWTQIGLLRKGRQKLAGFGDGKDTAWFLGGADEQAGSLSGEIDRFSQGRPDSGDLVELTISPPRKAAGAMQIDGIGLCLLGGQIDADTYADWWCDQPGEEAKLPILNPARAGLGTATIGKTIYVVGGYGKGFQGTSSFEAFTPSRG